MKAVIVGCGRVGASLAEELDRAGWQVLILDLDTSSFDRLPSSFGGTALRGDGTDEDVLRRAGAEDADLFLALTEGDNRNVMAAQLGIEALGARATVAIGLAGDERLDVVVANGAPTSAPSSRGERKGLGARGMAERVRAVGGEFETGPTGDGGWRVVARLPVRGAPSRSSGAATSPTEQAAR